MKKELRLTVEGRKIRFTNFIDEESRAFEASATAWLSGAPIEQRVFYYEHTRRKFYLLQIRAANGVPVMQACVQIGSPRLLPFFRMASVPQFHHAINDFEEEFGIGILRELCSELPGVMSLRIQPKRLQSERLIRFQSFALKQRFFVDQAIGTTRTLLLDLENSNEEMIAKFTQKIRAKFRHAGLQKMTIQKITDERYIESLREATNISRRKTGAADTQYDFETILKLAKATPNRVRIFGLFLNDRPKELLAYAIGFNHGDHAEFSAAGAHHDPDLRTMPFNYFLFAELANWARNQGCSILDMGGVTSGGPSDPLHGITRFKRSITENEIEIGREMSFIFHPLRLRFYRLLKQLREYKFIQPKTTNEEVITQP